MMIEKKSFPENIACAITDKCNLNDKQKQQVQDITTKMGTGAFDNITKNLNQIKSMSRMSLKID